jgi:hypothetical protein
MVAGGRQTDYRPGKEEESQGKGGKERESGQRKEKRQISTEHNHLLVSLSSFD